MPHRRELISMAISFRTLLLGAILLTLGSMQVSATPPPGSECPFGYNPTALVNFCYSESEVGGASGTIPGVPGVGTEEEEVCPIGNTCAPVPLPTVEPGAGIPYSIPGVPVVDPYVEVLGDELAIPYGKSCYSDPPGFWVGTGQNAFCVVLVNAPGTCVFWYDAESRERGDEVVCALQ